VITGYIILAKLYKDSDRCFPFYYMSYCNEWQLLSRAQGCQLFFSA